MHIELSSMCAFESNTIFKAGYCGGSISIEDSNVTFRGSVNLSESEANWSGGAIALTQAHMIIYGTAHMKSNKAGSFGGRLTADDSSLFFVVAV